MRKILNSLVSKTVRKLPRLLISSLIYMRGTKSKESSLLSSFYRPFDKVSLQLVQKILCTPTLTTSSTKFITNLDDDASLDAIQKRESKLIKKPSINFSLVSANFNKRSAHDDQHKSYNGANTDQETVQRHWLASRFLRPF